MSDKIQSLPYQPNPAKCCDACVFGGYEHADWCEITKTRGIFARGYQDMLNLHLNNPIGFSNLMDEVERAR